MQQRPPAPRWSPPVPHTQWMRPPARPAFVPPFPPPICGAPGPPRYYLPPPGPPRGYFPRFVPPRPPPPRPPVADPEQIWLEKFRQAHCNSVDTGKSVVNGGDEPPLRVFRRRVAQAQKLAEQLKVAAAVLARVETRLESLRADAEGNRRPGEDAAFGLEAARLKVQRERKLAVCESLKKELEGMTTGSGLFSEQQLAQIRVFATRVNKKKAYRKRVKQQRRAEASIRRAVESSKSNIEGATAINDSEQMPDTVLKRPEGGQDAAALEPPHAKTDSRKQHPGTYLSESPRTSKPSLDPEALTIDALIAVRRTWDAYIVFPRTPGASTIPPHFVPPPPAPSPQWAIFASPNSTTSVS